MLQTGPNPALAERLERSYYKLTATTKRHFAKSGDGWFLTGVAGLDAPTMNRAVVDGADVHEVGNLTREAADYFGERDCSWSVVLSTFREPRSWHTELVARGFTPNSTLDVLVRAPGPMEPVETSATIRVATEDEVGKFTELVMDVFRMPRRFYPALLDLTQAWKDAGSTLYLAELDDEIIGTTLLAQLDGVAGIYNVATTRHARRLGIARAMMARALEDSKNADVVTLQVAPEGFVEGFYLRLGFEPLYRWRFYSPRRG